jgi:hypothetical protein
MPRTISDDEMDRFASLSIVKLTVVHRAGLEVVFYSCPAEMEL